MELSRLRPPSISGELLLGAARRFALLLLGVVTVSASGSLAIGALFGASALRSISVGFYLAGSFLLIGGFLMGNQRPWRSLGGEFLAGRGEIRRRTAEERQEALGLSVTCFAIGILVVVLGVVADRRVTLF